jgi:dTDP-4-amino-4,6-dideoxygalactose transaminase
MNNPKPYKIPLFNLNYSEEEEKAVIETIKSKWISTGPKCTELENLFCEILEIQNSLTVSSCTAALHLSMVVLDIKKGDEVIVPSLTFAATVNAIKYVGATPVFADIKSYTDLTIDPLDIITKITKKTKAIIAMHFAGFGADMNSIMKIAKSNNLKVVEDACHAPLSDYKSKKLGTIGDIGTFSFFSNKNISTAEGGIMVSKNKKLIEKAKLLRSHGMTTLSYERSKGHATKYDIKTLGYNYRLDDIRAALGIVQLKKLNLDLQKRAVLRERYIKGLKDNMNILIPFKDRTEFVSNYIFPIVLKNSNSSLRDEFREKLHLKGVQTSVHYPAVHRFSIYKENYTELVNTDYVVENEVTLPMYGNLEMKEVDFICKTVNELTL